MVFLRLSAKATSGVGGFLAGAALDLIAFPTQAEPGTVSPEKIDALAVPSGIFGMSLRGFLGELERLSRALETAQNVDCGVQGQRVVGDAVEDLPE